MLKIRKPALVLPLIFIIFVGCSFEDDNSVQPGGNISTSFSAPLPEDLKENQPVTPTLSWSSGNADYFDIYLDVASGPGDKTPPVSLLNKQKHTSKSISVDPANPLRYYTWYKWQVIAHYGNQTVRSPVWKFRTASNVEPSPAGYLMKLYDVETIAGTHDIQILFQVLDLNNEGVAGLKESDFEILEDGEPLSPSESALSINSVPDIPFTVEATILIDNSNSVNQQLDAIKTAALDFTLNTLGRLSKINIDVFKFSETMEAVGPNNYSTADDANYWINTITLGERSTDFYGSIVKGAKNLKSSFAVNGITHSLMTVFSDGNDTQGSSTLYSAMNAVSGKLVYAIGFGPEEKTSVLSAIGTGGYYRYDSAGRAALQAHFTEIANSLDRYSKSFYRLNYSTPRRGAVTRTVTIRLKGNSYNSFIQTSYMGW